MAALSEEQSMIRDQAQNWVSTQSPVKKFREMRDSDVDIAFFPETWSSMVEMGWTGILVPEAYGGSELGNLTVGVVLEQIGRNLTASPLFASAVVGTSALVLAGNEDQKQHYLPKIVDGTSILTLAVDEGPRTKPEGVALSAEAAGDGFKLSGSKTFVHEGMAATDFVVAARTSGAAGETDRITLFIVPSDADGVSRNRLKTLDSRGYANVDFDGVTVGKDAVLGTVGEGFAPLDQILDRARATLAAEMLGTASQAFEMTLDYLKNRKQFGQVIGSFQALGHRAAAMFTAQELTRSCVEAALTAIDEGDDNVALMCSLSKCKAGEFMHDMSNELIQIHGGIGMTDEFDAGFYLKRARVLENAFGNQAFHKNRFAKLKGF